MDIKEEENRSLVALTSEVTVQWEMTRLYSSVHFNSDHFLHQQKAVCIFKLSVKKRKSSDPSAFSLRQLVINWPG